MDNKLTMLSHCVAERTSTVMETMRTMAMVAMGISIMGVVAKTHKTIEIEISPCSTTTNN